MPRTLTIIRVRYLPEDIYEGSISQACYENAEQDIYTDLSARETADIIKREGLSFAATGNDWAAAWDDSYTGNYATGEQVETTAHLDGYPERLHVAIINAVG